MWFFALQWLQWEGGNRCEREWTTITKGRMSKHEYLTLFIFQAFSVIKCNSSLPFAVRRRLHQLFCWCLRKRCWKVGWVLEKSGYVLSAVVKTVNGTNVWIKMAFRNCTKPTKNIFPCDAFFVRCFFLLTTYVKEHGWVFSYGVLQSYVLLQIPFLWPLFIMNLTISIHFVSCNTWDKKIQELNDDIRQRGNFWKLTYKIVILKNRLFVAFFWSIGIWEYFLKQMNSRTEESFV